MFRRDWPTGLLLAALFFPLTAFAGSQRETQATAPPAPPVAPIEHSDELLSKATVTGYFLADDQAVDFNLRHRFGRAVAWAGVFLDRGGPGQGRVGAEYDWERGPVLVVPTFNAGTNGLVAGSLYSELGQKVYAVLGYAITNLKPFYNLSFDPNDSVQFGLGYHVSSFDRVVAFAIVDVRLHTRQEDTHVLWRHRLSPREGITFDGVYKSGRTDAGRFVRAVGLGVYYDLPRLFLKAYWDPHVNFTENGMLRVGAGLKF